MRPTATLDSANPRDFDPARHIPESLQPYLTTADNPREIYVDRVHNSERRLRLLHRRFLNQITYGCKNPYCHVPTCFSYRKRVSGAAIRPYTDVSARTLATECVEQYASHGRESGRSSRKDQGKTKAIPGRVNGSLHRDNLCRNEPVIPWYADPDEYLAKLRAAASKDDRFKRDSAHRRHSTMQEQPGRQTNGYVPSPTAPKSNRNTRLNKRSEHDTVHVDQRDFSTNKTAGPNERASPSPEVSVPAPDKGMGDLPDAAYGIHAVRPQRSRNDHASLVQSLFSRPELRALDRPPDESCATGVSDETHGVNGVLRSSLSNSEVPRKYHVQSQVSQEHHGEPMDSISNHSLPTSLLKIELSTPLVLNILSSCCLQALYYG